MTTSRTDMVTANGAAMAAALAAGIGAFALGLVVILNEAGIYAAPTLYRPAGGVTGRTAIAAIIWLIAWMVLHARWKSRHVEPRSVNVATVVLTALGIILTFPPVWSLFG